MRSRQQRAQLFLLQQNIHRSFYGRCMAMATSHIFLNKLQSSRRNKLQKKWNSIFSMMHIIPPRASGWFTQYDRRQAVFCVDAFSMIHVTYRF